MEGESDGLVRLGMHVREDGVESLEGHDGQLEEIVFANGDRVPRRGLFVRPRQHPRCDLPAKLGYVFPSVRPLLRTQGYEQPTAPGLYVAGDVFRSTWVINAASEGVEAAYFMFIALLQEDLGLTQNS